MTSTSSVPVSQDRPAPDAQARQEVSLRADVASAVAHGRTLGATLGGCTDALVQHMGAAFARVWVLDERGATLLLRASSGMYTHLDGGHARVPVGAFKIGKIAATREPHCTNDVLQDPFVDRAWASREGLVSFAGYPLMYGDRVLGVIALFARHTLPGETLDLLASIADLVAVGIERERGAMALRSSEARYRSLVAASTQIVWTTDAAGVVHEDCPSWRSFTGHSVEQWLEGGVVAALHPDDAPRVVAAWSDAIAAGCPFAIEYRLRRADAAYATVVVRGVPVTDDAGAILEWVGTITDITEQRRAEAAAALERARLGQVFEDMPAAITTTRGPEHVVEHMNAAGRRLLGGRDLVGFRVRDALPEVEGQGYFELLDRVYATGTPFFASEAPVRLRRSGDDGAAGAAYFNLAYQPLVDVDGNVDGVLSFSVEVTDLVQARERVEKTLGELARTNAELDQFAYVASHDLKAPLRGIANLAQWIEEDLGEGLPPSVRTNMDLLKGRVGRLEALIDGILDYSRAGRARGKTERVDCGVLLADIRELLAPAPPAAIHVRGPLPVVEAERVKLEQVLLNLVSNALKHGGRDDVQVEVGATDVGDAWELYVADDGPGIAPEFHERVWSIFQTLAARDEVEGTGIGLSVVRKIVETNGGRAWIDGSVKRGATFRFTWPKVPPPRTAR